MFFFAWILLILAGLMASVVILSWALRTGQFAEQERARYLPLRDRSHRLPVADPSKLSLEVYFLLFSLVLGVAGMLGTILLSLYHLKG